MDTYDLPATFVSYKVCRLCSLDVASILYIEYLFQPSSAQGRHDCSSQFVNKCTDEAAAGQFDQFQERSTSQEHVDKVF